uniref:Syntaxin 17 n=1 Tax=Oryzias sinensis TaxID=183150 RepID=A0A8C7XNL4_9TELE
MPRLWTCSSGRSGTELQLPRETFCFCTLTLHQRSPRGSLDVHPAAATALMTRATKQSREGKVSSTFQKSLQIRMQRNPGITLKGWLVPHTHTKNHSQQEKIDSIEDNINTASTNVEEGTKSLGKAVGYKLAVLPVAGALLGGVLGGPLGLLAGFKVAGVAAALGGGALGFAGGNLVQKHRRAQVDKQMKQVTEPPHEGQQGMDE